MNDSDTWQHDGKTYIEDDILERLPLGNATYYGKFLAKNRKEAGMLVGEFLCALNSGGPITPRQFCFVSWLIQPVLEGEDPRCLPFKKKMGRPRAKQPNLRVTMQLLEVHRRRKKIGLERAISEVAGDVRAENSLRGHYERMTQAQLDTLAKEARHLSAVVRKAISDKKRHHKK